MSSQIISYVLSIQWSVKGRGAKFKPGGLHLGPQEGTMNGTMDVSLGSAAWLQTAFLSVSVGIFQTNLN